MRWWSRDKEEPQEEPDDEAGEERHETLSARTYGMWEEQLYKIVIYVHVTPRDGAAPYPASYTLVVPDYNVDAVTSTLNYNGAIYTVAPMSGQGGDED